MRDNGSRSWLRQTLVAFAGMFATSVTTAFVARSFDVPVDTAMTFVLIGYVAAFIIHVGVDD